MHIYPTVNIKHRGETISLILLDEDFYGYELIFNVANQQFDEVFCLDASGDHAVFNVTSIGSVDIDVCIHFKKVLSLLYPSYEL